MMGNESKLGSGTDTAPFHNAVPAPITALIGRREEVEAIHGLLKRSRLVTITGIGGMGKTRLAVQVATESLDRFRHGVCFVPVGSPDIEHSLVEVIGRHLDINFLPTPNPFEQLASYLRQMELLLVLDGFEHVEAEQAILAKLLQAASGVRLLVTSRLVPEVGTGAEYPLGGLRSTPDPNSELSDAMLLFVESAKRSRSDFILSDANCEHVLQICQRLDGMPMAIEQAASWTRILSVAEIAVEIEANIGSKDCSLLGSDIEAIVDYSWSLLSKSEQKMVCRLAIFPSDFDMAAARKVSGGSLSDLASLHDKAMLMSDDRQRYRLHALIRAYALRQKCVAKPGCDPQRLFMHHYLDILSSLRDGPYDRKALKTVTLLRMESTNVRAAWLLAISLHEYSILIENIKALFWFFVLNSRFADGAELVGRLLQALDALPPETAAIDPVTLAEVRARYAYLLVDRADEALASHQRTLARQVAEENDDHHLLYWCYLSAANVAQEQSEFGASLAAAQSALDTGEDVIDANERVHALLFVARAAAQTGATEIVSNALDEIEQLLHVEALPYVHVQVLSCKSLVALMHDDLGGSISLLEATVAQFQEMLNHPYAAARCLCRLGFLYALSPLYEGSMRAEAATLSARRIYASVGDRQMLGKTSINLGIIERARLNFTAALGHFREARQIAVETGDRDGMAIVCFNMGDLFVRVGLFDRAEEQFEEGLKFSQMTRPNHSYIKLAQAMSAICDDYLRRVRSAALLAGLGTQLAEQLPSHLINLHVWPHVGELCLRNEELAAAQQVYMTVYGQHSHDHHIKRHDGAAGLAQTALLRGELDEAVMYVNTILDSLKDDRVESLLKTDRPFQICYACYQVLAAANDSRASDHLIASVGWLYRVADAIEDGHMRHAFLYNVPVHAQLLAVSEASSRPVIETAVVDPVGVMLTAREQEILRLVSQGLTNQQIGDQLVITRATVRRHLSNIYGKLNVDNRVSLINQAVALHLLDSNRSS